MDARHLDLLLANQPEHECGLGNREFGAGLAAQTEPGWQSGEVIVITPADLVIAEEAYDQARWTGQPVNMDLLREAYEEYVDFLIQSTLLLTLLPHDQTLRRVATTATTCAGKRGSGTELTMARTTAV